MEVSGDLKELKKMSMRSNCENLGICVCLLYRVRFICYFSLLYGSVCLVLGLYGEIYEDYIWNKTRDLSRMGESLDIL